MVGVFYKVFQCLGSGTGGGVSVMSKTHNLGIHCQGQVKTVLEGMKNGSSQILFGQNANSKLQALIIHFSQKLNVMGTVLTQQCNRVAAHRLKRAYQILLLYERIYGEQVLMQKLKTSIQLRAKPFLFMLSATIFQWENQRVTDDDLQRCEEEIEEVHKLVELSHKPKLETESCPDAELSEWEQVIDNPDFKLWRRLVTGTELYQYRVYGCFSDISPRAFYNTQCDLDYWMVWDKHTMEVKVMDNDEETGSQVVHWTYKYPFPMYPRDYVYVRRAKVDHSSNRMVLTARSTDHPDCPVSDSCVRVANYSSSLVIKPYTTFDENGFDYVMTYLDDPKTNFPTVCYNWMASTGVHEFLERVHKAARKKHERSIEAATSRVHTSDGGLYGNMVHQ